MGQITYFNSSSVVPSTSMGQLVEKPRYGLAFSALKIEIGSPESHGQLGSTGQRSRGQPGSAVTSAARSREHRDLRCSDRKGHLSLVRRTPPTVISRTVRDQYAKEKGTPRQSSPERQIEAGSQSRG